MHWLVSLPSTLSQRLCHGAWAFGLGSRRTCRRLQEPQASLTKVACHRHTPEHSAWCQVPEYCARKWEPLPLKQALCLTPLLNIYRQSSVQGRRRTLLPPTPTSQAAWCHNTLPKGLPLNLAEPPAYHHLMLTYGQRTRRR